MPLYSDTGRSTFERCPRAVSTVDVPTLRRIWKGDEPDPGRVRKIIEPFVAEETVTAIHFRWRKDGRGPNRAS